MWRNTAPSGTPSAPGSSLEDVSETLFELAPSTPAAPRRVTSKGIAPGDIVEIDKKGRHFHALVKEIHQDPKGYYHLDLKPFDRAVDVANRAAGRAFLAHHVPGLQRLPDFHIHAALLHAAIEREAELPLGLEP